MIRWIVLQRGGTLQERVPPYLRFTLTCPPSEQEGTACFRLRFISPTGVAKSFAWLSLYAYPAGTSFCSCASSRATLHVGSLFPWNRQPSNAPPLLLSPTGHATRRGPLLQNTLGEPRDPHARRAQPALQSGRPSATLRAALSAAVRPPLPTRSCDLAGTPLARSERLRRPEAWAKRCL